MQFRRNAVAFTSAAALSLGGVALATPASAAPPVDQDGLINLNVQDVNIQAPVAVAAAICGLDVNVLSQQLAQTGAVDCPALAQGTATRPTGGGGGGPVQQNGLVNINVTDVNVQIPIAAAVTVCGVSVNVLSTVRLPAGPIDCPAIARAVAA